MESGKKNDRPELQNALVRCKLSRATLIIAKLDRLSRNMAFIANLMESGVDFVACDNPYANKLTIHILTAIAEHEREMISKRTKEALAAAKAKGVKLGGYRGDFITPQVRSRGVESRRARSLKYAKNIYPTIRSHMNSGNSLNSTAKKLNEGRVFTARGGKWTATAVSRVIQQLESVEDR